MDEYGTEKHRLDIIRSLTSGCELSYQQINEIKLTAAEYALSDAIAMKDETKAKEYSKLVKAYEQMASDLEAINQEDLKGQNTKQTIQCYTPVTPSLAEEPSPSIELSGAKLDDQSNTDSGPG